MVVSVRGGRALQKTVRCHDVLMTAFNPSSISDGEMPSVLSTLSTYTRLVGGGSGLAEAAWHHLAPRTAAHEKPSMDDSR